MVFSSAIFLLLFLPVVFILNYFAGKNFQMHYYLLPVLFSMPGESLIM